MRREGGCGCCSRLCKEFRSNVPVGSAWVGKCGEDEEGGTDEVVGKAEPGCGDAIEVVRKTSTVAVENARPPRMRRL